MTITNDLSTDSTAYLVPLLPQAQDFFISLNGTTYYFQTRWNAPNNAWTLDISDANQNQLVTGLALITGCDLLEQFYHLGIGGALVVQSANDPTLVPNYSTLGTTGNLYFLLPEIIA